MKCHLVHHFLKCNNLFDITVRYNAFQFNYKSLRAFAGRSYSSSLTPTHCDETLKAKCPDESLDKSIKSPRVIIVGAGIAGLSAAQRLINYGINDIVVLEACDRIGGRIHTCNIDGKPRDLGAHWIRGATIANSVFNLSLQERLLPAPVPIIDPFRGIFVLSDGTPVCKEVLAKCKRILKTLLCNVQALVHDPDQTRFHFNDSIWNFFLHHIELETSMMSQAESRIAKSVLLAMMNCVKAQLGAELCDIPVERFACSSHCIGGDTSFPEGFGAILRPLVNSMTEDRLYLNKEVSTIKWSNAACPDEERVSVKTYDGCVYNGDYVIVTVSLGVLKASYKNMFCPQLPPDKIEAIEKIGFGDINKVFLHYDKPFWVPGEATIRVCWDLKEIGERPSWIQSIALIEETPGVPTDLTFTIGGPSAQCIEDLNENTIAKDITKLINVVMNNPSLPYPNKILRTKWRSNKFFGGAVSYFTKDTYFSHMTKLAESLPKFKNSPAPSLLFAGEATVPGLNGTAHGARISGIREAETLYELTKMFKGAPPKFEESIQAVL